jgi:hypothetical protein
MRTSSISKTMHRKRRGALSRAHSLLTHQPRHLFAVSHSSIVHIRGGFSRAPKTERRGNCRQLRFQRPSHGHVEISTRSLLGALPEPGIATYQRRTGTRTAEASHRRTTSCWRRRGEGERIRRVKVGARNDCRTKVRVESGETFARGLSFSGGRVWDR